MVSEILVSKLYEVGWDFVIDPEQHQPHQNLAASHTGEVPSCRFYLNKGTDKSNKQ